MSIGLPIGGILPRKCVGLALARPVEVEDLLEALPDFRPALDHLNAVEIAGARIFTAQTTNEGALEIRAGRSPPAARPSHKPVFTQSLCFSTSGGIPAAEQPHLNMW